MATSPTAFTAVQQAPDHALAHFTWRTGERPTRQIEQKSHRGAPIVNAESRIVKQPVRFDLATRQRV